MNGPTQYLSCIIINTIASRTFKDFYILIFKVFRSLMFIFKFEEFPGISRTVGLLTLPQTPSISSTSSHVFQLIWKFPYCLRSNLAEHQFGAQGG
jgi:hypothetical protein